MTKLDYTEDFEDPDECANSELISTITTQGTKGAQILYYKPMAPKLFDLFCMAVSYTILSPGGSPRGTNISNDYYISTENNHQ